VPKVVFFTSLSAEPASLVTGQAPAEFEVTVQPISMRDEEKIPLVRDADFLILFPGHISDQVLHAAPKLKLIQLVSAGFDQLNLALCQELGIPIANNGGTNSIDVAEHTLMLILSFYRRLIELDRNTRTNRWRDIDTGLSTYTIDGKTVGIVGLGNIGQQVARRLKPFGARLLYYDAYPPPPEIAQKLGVTQVALKDLLQQADIITLHVPLNKETRGLIGKEALALMKPTALLVNTCRGPVVDETALTEALRSKQIAGAALDVLEQEPPEPDNPILKLDNVLLTPHTAGVTYDTWARRGQFIFQNLQRVWQGQPPLAMVSK
jgi:phosphoglycerate dehydrogenase-like enzyme